MNQQRHLRVGSCGALALSAVLLTAGCGDPPRSPMAPATQPPATTPAAETYLRGQVTDAVWRPVPAALIEIVSGPLAGARRVADDDGRFEFTSTAFAESFATVRVSKDGFETTSSTATWQHNRDRYFVTRLSTLAPPGAFGEGDYSLTFSFDLATARGFPATKTRPEIPCHGFPPDLASRTYDARITERPQGERIVSIKGPTVQPFSDEFTMHVGRDAAAVDMEWFIGEEYPGHRYLYIGGGPVPTPFAIDANAVRMPFAADFRYCELVSARGIYNECSQVPLDQVVHQQWCRSDAVMMTFVKR